MIETIKKNLFQVSTLAGIVSIVAGILGYEASEQWANAVAGVVVGVFMVVSDLPTGLRKK